TEIDLVVTNMIMSKPDGRTARPDDRRVLSAPAIRLRPSSGKNTRACQLFTCLHIPKTTSFIAGRPEPGLGLAFIGKPFSPEQLVDAVQSELAKPISC